MVPSRARTVRFSSSDDLRKRPTAPAPYTRLLSGVPRAPPRRPRRGRERHVVRPVNSSRLVRKVPSPTSTETDGRPGSRSAHAAIIKRLVRRSRSGSPQSRSADEAVEAHESTAQRRAERPRRSSSVSRARNRSSRGLQVLMQAERCSVRSAVVRTIRPGPAVAEHPDERLHLRCHEQPASMTSRCRS